MALLLYQSLTRKEKNENNFDRIFWKKTKSPEQLECFDSKREISVIDEH